MDAERVVHGVFNQRGLSVKNMTTLWATAAMRDALRWRNSTAHVFCLLFLVSGSAGAQPVPRPAKAAVWTVEKFDVGDSYGRHLSVPSLAAKGDTVAIIGDYFPWSMNPTEPAGMLFLQPGGRIALPPGYGTGYPKAIYDRKGTLHIFWAEFNQAPSSIFAWQSGVRAVWHSALSPRGWSPADRVAAGRQIEWSLDEGEVAVDVRNRLHVLVQVIDTSDLGLGDYEFADDRWGRRVIAIMGTFARVATTSEGTLVAAFKAFDVADGRYKLFSRRFLTAEERWEPPTALTAPEGNVERLRLVATASEVSAVWVEQEEKRDETTLVRFDLDAAGLRWSETSRIPLSASPARLSVFESPCVGLTALMITRTANDLTLGSRLSTVEWEGHRVVENPSAIPLTGAAIDIGATATARGSVAAIFALGTQAENLVARRESCRAR